MFLQRPSPQSWKGAVHTCTQEPLWHTPWVTLKEGHAFPQEPQLAVVLRLTQVPFPAQSPYPEAQTHTLLPPQAWFAPQLPQLRVPPQPSGIVPQVLPCAAQVVGWQQVLLERHTCPEGQAPHESDPPQPSDAVPQAAPTALHVAGWQAPGVCDFMLPI